MSVAYPWMDASPAPLTSHTRGGVPGSRFSRVTGLPAGAAEMLKPIVTGVAGE